MILIKQKTFHLSLALMTQDGGSKFCQDSVALSQIVVAIGPGIDAKRGKPHGIVLPNGVEDVGLRCRAPGRFGYEDRIPCPVIPITPIAEVRLVNIGRVDFNSIPGCLPDVNNTRLGTPVLVLTWMHICSGNPPIYLDRESVI